MASGSRSLCVSLCSAPRMNTGNRMLLFKNLAGVWNLGVCLSKSNYFSLQLETWSFSQLSASVCLLPFSWGEMIRSDWLDHRTQDIRAERSNPMFLKLFPTVYPLPCFQACFLPVILALSHWLAFYSCAMTPVFTRAPLECYRDPSADHMALNGEVLIKSSASLEYFLCLKRRLVFCWMNSANFSYIPKKW